MDLQIRAWVDIHHIVNDSFLYFVVGPITGDIYADIKKKPKTTEDTPAVISAAGNREKPEGHQNLLE